MSWNSPQMLLQQRRTEAAASESASLPHWRRTTLRGRSRPLLQLQPRPRRVLPWPLRRRPRNQSRRLLLKQL